MAIARLLSRLRGPALVRTVAFCLVAAVALLWLAPRETPYDGPFHLAERLWQGKVGFDEATPWWEMFERDGRHYLCYAPLASVVLMPFVWLKALGVSQPMVNALFLLGTALLMRRLLRRLRPTRRWADWGAIGYLLGSPILYSISVGNVWLLLHAEGNFFLTAAALAAVRSRWAAFGFFYAMACGCRNGLLFMLPFTLLFLLPRRWDKAWARRRALRRLGRFVLGASVPTLVGLALQTAMTGSPFVTTYAITYAQWKTPILYSTEFLKGNAHLYFLELPKWKPSFPFLSFPRSGQTFWSVSPFFLLLPLARPTARWLRAGILACVLGFAPYMFFCWNGFAQFGSRYVTDLFPFLIPLAASAAGRFRGRVWTGLAWALMGLAVAINALAAWQMRTGTMSG